MLRACRSLAARGRLTDYWANFSVPGLQVAGGQGLSAETSTVTLAGLQVSGNAGGQAQAFDSFNGTAGTDLAAHTADNGGTWTLNSAYPGGTAVLTASNDLRCNSSTQTAIYSHSQTPLSADYDVSAVVNCYTNPSTPEAAGVIGRMVSGAGTYYVAQYHATVGWQLYKVIATAATQLGSDLRNAPEPGAIGPLDPAHAGDLDLAPGQWRGPGRSHHRQLDLGGGPGGCQARERHHRGHRYHGQPPR